MYYQVIIKYLIVFFRKPGPRRAAPAGMRPTVVSLSRASNNAKPMLWAVPEE
jgi:hypothetical protein